MSRKILKGIPFLEIIREDSHHQIHFLEGEAASVIPKFAEESRIDLIVMGTIMRTGIAGTN